MINVDLRCWVEAEQYKEIRNWCIENFGKANERETWSLLANNDVGGEIYFQNEEDAMAFKLRWT